MSNYDDDSRAEYSSSMAEYGFDDVEPEDGLDDAIDELMNDLESLPDKIQQLFDYLFQGYDIADAAYYAGYGNSTEGLHKVLKKDTGQPVKDKLRTLKEAHGAGKQRADERAAAASS
jgi:hypothetical protein